MTLDPATIAAYCPVFYFHPYEQTYPCSIEYLANGSAIKKVSDPSYNVPLTSANCQSTLGQAIYSDKAIGDDVYIDVATSQYGGELGSDGSIIAPMYYAVRQYPTITDISYLLLYAFQDGQTINCAQLSDSDIIVRTYGQHQGDLERVVVRLETATGRLLSIGFEAHGDLSWFRPDQCTFENTTHVVAYSALCGHSSRNMPAGSSSYEFIDESVNIGPIHLLSVRSYIATGGKAWRPTSLRQLGHDASGQPYSDQLWATYCGRLGQIHQAHSLDSATYLNGDGLSGGDWAIVKAIDWAGSVAHKLPASALFGDGPSGPGDRDWAYPTDNEQWTAQGWANGGNAWSGIEAVLGDITDWLSGLGPAAPTAKVAACDARHLDALGWVISNPAWPPFDPNIPGANPGQWTNQVWPGSMDLNNVFGLINNQPSGDPPLLDPMPLGLSQVIIANRNDGGDDAPNMCMFWTLETPDPPPPRPAFDPAAWVFTSFSEGGDGSAGILNVFNDLLTTVNARVPPSLAVKFTADDRRHGNALGFLFENPTARRSDLQYVLDPTGWQRVTWESVDPGDILAILNGGPLPDGTVLTWPQVCTSKVVFTNREEGGDDGATFSIIYPLIP